MTSRTVLSFLLVIFLSASLIGQPFVAIAQNEEEAQKRLETLEKQREAEEVNLQMGYGLSNELRDGYLKLQKDYPSNRQTFDWAEYRLAEFDYSRDRFAEALIRLDQLAVKAKGSEIGVEADLLAVEILDSPYNKKNGDTKKSEERLRKLLKDNGNNQRAKAAQIARESSKLSRKSESQTLKGKLTGELSHLNFQEVQVNATSEKRLRDEKYNEDLAKAFRNLSLSQASEGNYEASFVTLDKVAKEYKGKNPFNYFTFSTTRQDIEYQRTLTIVLQGKTQEAILALKEFETKYPDSHLASRAAEKRESLEKSANISMHPKAQASSNLRTTQAKAPERDLSNSIEDQETVEPACICGPAALQVALGKMGNQQPIDQLIAAAGATADGTTMAGMLKAARSVGVNAYGMEVPTTEFSKLPMPSVVLLRDHYVTITSVEGDQASVYDPLIGWTMRPLQELAELSGGAVMVFAANEAAAINALPGARILTEEELEKLKGRFLCGNQAGLYPGCLGPCLNFEPYDPPAEGVTDGLSSVVNRVNGNHYVETPPIVLRGVENTDIDFKLSYNSQAGTRDSDAGMGWSFSYSDQLITVDNNVQWLTSDGSRLTFVLNVDGTYTSPPGVMATLTKHEDGTATLLEADRDRLNFDAQGRLKSKVDRNGQGVQITHDAQGKIMLLLDTKGQQMSLNYDGAGKIDSVQSGGKQVNLDYDPSSGYLSKVQFSDQRAWTFTYDLNQVAGSGLMTSVMDSRGKETKFQYNQFGQIDWKQNALGKKETYCCLNTAVSSVTVTNYAGEKTSYFSSPTNSDSQLNNAVTEQRDVLGKSFRYTYTPDNQVKTKTDPLGNVTTYEYYPNGTRKAVIDPLTNRTSYTYNSKKQIETVTDALGRTTAYSYDEAGNLLSVTDPLGKKMVYTYYPNGNLWTFIDFGGAKTTYTYNNKGWLETVTDALNHVTTYTYDELGRRKTVKDPLSQVTTYNYDDYGHVTAIYYPDGTSEAMVYEGQLLSTKKDRRGYITSYGYDDLGRVETVTEPTGAITTYTYDAQGRIKAVKDPKGNITDRSYDSKGRLSSIVYSGGLRESYTYDAMDRVLTKIDPLGVTTTYSYDELGRIRETRQR